MSAWTDCEQIKIVRGCVNKSNKTVSTKAILCNLYTKDQLLISVTTLYDIRIQIRPWQELLRGYKYEYGTGRQLIIRTQVTTLPDIRFNNYFFNLAYQCLIIVVLWSMVRITWPAITRYNLGWPCISLYKRGRKFFIARSIGFMPATMGVTHSRLPVLYNSSACCYHPTEIGL